MRLRRIEVLLLLTACMTSSVLTGCRGKRKTVPLPQREGYVMGGSLAFDGTHFWATQYPKLDRIDESREVVKFDRDGNVVATFTPDENFHGLAFDGQNIWTADVFGWAEGRFFGEHGNFYILDPETGELHKQFTIPETYGDLNGLAAGGNRLWAFVDRDQIFEIDPESGSVVNQLEVPESFSCTAMKFLDGYLWVVKGLIKKEVLKIDPKSGNILKEYDYTGRVLNGIATDGKDIYLVDGDKLELFVLRR